MNFLAIDYGLRRVGLAYSLAGTISTLPALPNDQNLIPNIREIVDKYQIGKVYVGLSSGQFAVTTMQFVTRISDVLKLPVETVDESVSTLEAGEIFKNNQKKVKNYHQDIDSISAAVVLRRVIDSS